MSIQLINKLVNAVVSGSLGTGRNEAFIIASNFLDGRLDKANLENMLVNGRYWIEYENKEFVLYS